eukprot:9503553-Pyramimonas_sp.AAC.1
MRVIVASRLGSLSAASCPPAPHPARCQEAEPRADRPRVPLARRPAPYRGPWAAARTLRRGPLH